MNKSASVVASAQTVGANWRRWGPGTTVRYIAEAAVRQLATAPPVVTSQPITALLWRYGDAETRLRETLAELYRELGRRGMNVGSTGNVSARTDGGMLITPSGVRVDTVSGERLVRCRFDGSYDGALLPSSEWEMHAAIYRQAPKAQVIVHTHSDYATALACLGLPLPGFHYAVAEFGSDDIRCAPYATFGTAALADLAAEAIAGRTACLLANHGMICHGRDADTALLAAVRLEGLARQYLIARTAGSVRLLSPEEMAAAQIRYRTYGVQPADGDAVA
jgi:L-fuculose-phosphate aldolase